MSRNIDGILVAATLLIIGACGGCGGSSPSQSEMIRLAMERKKAQQAAEAKSEKKAAPAPTRSTPDTTPSPKPPSEAPPIAPKPVPTSPADTSKAIVNQEPPKQELPKVVADNHKPDKPLSVAEQRQRTIENLERIGQALNRYLDENGCFPTPAIYDESLSPLLSWRVELLPFLGHGDLHKRFRLDQPWDSPHNRNLLPLIPPVYQSPERFRELTNYVVPVSAGTAFPGRRGVPARKIEDGAANTIVLLEVDDELAVPWTKPDDYLVKFGKPAEGIGSLRTGHFFAAWGDGTVGQIPVDRIDKYWKAMMSIDGGEPFSASQISQTPVLENTPSPPVVAASTDTEKAGDLAMRELASKASPAEQPPESLGETEPASEVTQDEDIRLPVPTESARRLARELYREIFQSEYEDAVTEEEKLEFAEKVRAHADKLLDDPAGQYVLLDISAIITAQAGSVVAALEVVETTRTLFQTDATELAAKVLEASAGLVLSTKENEATLQAATDLMDQAIKLDDFDLAARMHAVAMASARRSDDKRLVLRITERREEITNAKSAFRQVAHLIDALAVDPSDAQANLEVGEYCCFAKGQWENGLPMLSRGSDLSLARLAERELKSPGDPHQMVALADSWWEASQQTTKYSEAMRDRATHWYEQALPDLAAGLERVKAEIRIKLARDRK